MTPKYHAAHREGSTKILIPLLVLTEGNGRDVAFDDGAAFAASIVSRERLTTQQCEGWHPSGSLVQIDPSGESLRGSSHLVLTIEE